MARVKPQQGKQTHAKVLKDISKYRSFAGN
jgi:hypothetical protein